MFQNCTKCSMPIKVANSHCLTRHTVCQRRVAISPDLMHYINVIKQIDSLSHDALLKDENLLDHLKACINTLPLKPYTDLSLHLFSKLEALADDISRKAVVHGPSIKKFTTLIQQLGEKKNYSVTFLNLLGKILKDNDDWS